MDDIRQQALLKEPPEISWENTLGAPDGVPFDDDTKELLRRCIDVSTSTPTTLTQIMKRSEAFPINFPINTVRCSALKERGISTNILEVRRLKFLRYFLSSSSYLEYKISNNNIEYKRITINNSHMHTFCNNFKIIS